MSSPPSPDPARRVRWVLGFPARGPATSDPLLDGFVAALGDAGADVEQVPLQVGAPDDELVAAYVDAVRRSPRADADLVIGGFSLGARIAVTAALQLGSACALVAMGYPFHPRGCPGQATGVPRLAALCLPTLIVQGTRDAHGNRAWVHGASLPPCVELAWVEDGNHRWVPRARSDVDADALIEEAARTALAFVHRPLIRPQNA